MGKCNCRGGWVRVVDVEQIGSVEVMRRRSAPEIRASAQALFTSCSYGLGPLLSALLATVMLDGAGTRGLFAVGAVLSAAAAGRVVVAERRDGEEAARAEPVGEGQESSVVARG